MPKTLLPTDWRQYPSRPRYKIYDLMPKADYDRTKLPLDTDFKTGLEANLYKEVTMVNGAPLRKTYYAQADVQEDNTILYSNPIVKIEYEFERDSISLAISCTQKFYWMDVNENWSETCKSVKDYFSYAESIAEAEQRRRNIISTLKVETIGLLMQTEGITQEAAAELGRVFLAVYKAEIINYIDEANSDFSLAVTNASALTYPWLENDIGDGTTIREFILNGLV